MWRSGVFYILSLAFLGLAVATVAVNLPDDPTAGTIGAAIWLFVAWQLWRVPRRATLVSMVRDAEDDVVQRLTREGVSQRKARRVVRRSLRRGRKRHG